MSLFEQEDQFNVSKGDDGVVVLEIWNGKKKMTVYLPESLDILQVHGLEVYAEITDAQDFYESWQWLHEKG